MSVPSPSENAKEFVSTFHPSRLAVTDKPPSRAARFILLSIVLFFSTAATWLYLSRVDVVVSATGQLVPAGRVKVIQAAEAGVVQAIHVRDGQLVKQGDILVELDATTSEADTTRLQAEFSSLDVQRHRLQAQLQQDPEQFAADIDGISPADHRLQQALLVSQLREHDQRLARLQAERQQRVAEIESIRQSLQQWRRADPLIRERLTSLESLSGAGHSSKLDLNDARLAVVNHEKEGMMERQRKRQAEASLVSLEREVELVKAEFRRTTLAELTDVSTRMEAVRQELIKASQRQELNHITAPVSGVVQELAVHTIGGVVTAAQPLLTLVPEDLQLEVEAKLLNKDIGAVLPGQTVAVKLEAYDFTRHGALEGKIEWVGTDAVADENLGAVYPVRVSLAGEQLPNNVDGKRGRAIPGMSVTADIAIGQRRMLDYFLGPLLRYRDESMRER